MLAGIRLDLIIPECIPPFLYRMSMERFGQEWKQKTRKLFQVAGYMDVLRLERIVKWCRRRE